jgi:hypothetical protein
MYVHIVNPRPQWPVSLVIIRLRRRRYTGGKAVGKIKKSRVGAKEGKAGERRKKQWSFFGGKMMVMLVRFRVSFGGWSGLSLRAEEGGYGKSRRRAHQKYLVGGSAGEARFFFRGGKGSTRLPARPPRSCGLGRERERGGSGSGVE